MAGLPHRRGFAQRIYKKEESLTHGSTGSPINLAPGELFTSGKREKRMGLDFMDFEIPLLKALVKFGGKARPAEAYLEVEKGMICKKQRFKQ